MSDIIAEFAEELRRRFGTGLATEHSYRPCLQGLLEAADNTLTPVNEPRRQRCGAPDFVILRGKTPVGYVECKDPAESLDDKKQQEQFQRYRDALENLVITNGLEWRLYHQSVERSRTVIAVIEGGKVKLLPSEYPGLLALLNTFLTTQAVTVKSSKELAGLMAKKAHALRQSVLASMRDMSEADQRASDLSALFEACRKMLVHEMTLDSFADVVSQTVLYGFFTARILDPTRDTFDRFEAEKLIPGGNSFLRKFFQYISRSDLDKGIDWIIDDIADLFLHADPVEILKQYGKATKRNDPILHFYEEFLGEYDPKLKKSKGVFYTPEAIVDFNVRAVDEILREKFGFPDGLRCAEKVQITSGAGKYKTIDEYHKVQILDPAVGTGTFLNAVVRLVAEPYQSSAGEWSQYVREHLLPRLHGFDCMPTPYAIAHLKLASTLKELGFPDVAKVRFSICLTNSLEPAAAEHDTLFGQWLAEEVRNASRVKELLPVMVVIGNPPYLGESKNKSEWIMALLDDYKMEPGGKVKLHERNPKWLNDDYVKFIRLAENFIERNGQGVVAYITNHAFIDNPTFRGMRWHLAQTFDEIYILDLHGNSKKKEKCPDGSKDENVFDIGQGVALLIAFKTGAKRRKTQPGKVFHHELFGKRAQKFGVLLNENLTTIPWKPVELRAPAYLFVPKDNTLEAEYKQGVSLIELFPVNSVGIVTARDGLAIHYSKEKLWRTVIDFAALPVEEARSEYKLGEDVRDWKVAWAQEDVRKSGPRQSLIVPMNYRPFDVRHTYYTGKSCGFICNPRSKVMRHFIGEENVGLVAPKQTKEEVGAFVTKYIIGHKLFSAYDINNVFPLYLYSSGDALDGGERRRPNLDAGITAEFAGRLGLAFEPEKTGAPAAFAPIDLLDYVYAVLHSPSYREKYREFLRSDFPRVPYPADADVFRRLARLGGELRQLHLLEHPDLRDAIRLPVKFPVAGDNRVDKRQIKFKEGKVHINITQYFDGVPEAVWTFQVGGYFPAQKWLKDRDARPLSADDLAHYKRVVEALRRTLAVMAEINAHI